MDEKLIIDVSRLKSEGETVSGEVDAVDLDEEFVKSFGGIRYIIKNGFGYSVIQSRLIIFIIQIRSRTVKSP